MKGQQSLCTSPVVISSQAQLFSLIDDGSSPRVEQIGSLSLQLTDIDISTILDPEVRKSPRPSIHELYEQELHRLCRALRFLSHLVSLTVIPPRSVASAFVRGMYLAFLGQIPRDCPNLKHLTIRDGVWVIEHAPILKQLPNVTLGSVRAGDAKPLNRIVSGRTRTRVSPSPGGL